MSTTTQFKIIPQQLPLLEKTLLLVDCRFISKNCFKKLEVLKNLEAEIWIIADSSVYDVFFGKNIGDIIIVNEDVIDIFMGMLLAVHYCNYTNVYIIGNNDVKIASTYLSLGDGINIESFESVNYLEQYLW